LEPASIPVTCNKDCGAGCPLLAYVEDGRVTRIGDNPLGGPYMTGCVRGYQMTRALYAPDRIRKPLVRTGPRGAGQFKEVDWPDALDLVAHRLAEIRDQYGNEAVIHLGGSGSCRGALHNTNDLALRFLGLYGGYTETASNYSVAAADFATPYVLGTKMTGIDAGTLQFSNLIILWGANPSDTRMGCDLEARIREARDRGVDVIVIDPRRARTVRRLGSRWLQVLPGGDAALMMAVLFVLIEEDLIDRGFVAKTSTGFDELEAYVMGTAGHEPKTPAWAEATCGTPAEDIASLARQYGRTRPAALIPGPSIQRNIGGEEAIRMAVALQVATGNLGILGGSTGALAHGSLPYPSVAELRVPPNPIQTSVPVVLWPDAILEGKPGGYPSDIKAIYNVGGNYLVQGSDVRKNIRAFEQVEFAVTHDYVLTPTAQYCDVVLPATTFLERNDIVYPKGGNYLLFSNQAVEPVHESRNDYDIFCELAGRLGFLDQFSEGRNEKEWLQHFVARSEIPDFQEFKDTGIYFGKDQSRVALAEFARDPKAHPLRTPSGRVEISSHAYAQTGYPPIPTSRMLPTDEGYPLRLVTPHPRYRTHSQYDNIPWFKQKEKQTLWLHPLDAAARGIDDGQEVYVRSPQGTMRIEAEVTERIMNGVVCLLEGAWPVFDAGGTEAAGSVNVLTSTEPTQPSQGTRTHSVLVEVTTSI
jgi:anaerobic dimethyl sulfoxide reductase subunit A